MLDTLRAIVQLVSEVTFVQFSLRDIVSDNSLPPGLYDRLVDVALSQQLALLDDKHLAAAVENVAPSEIPKRAASIVSEWIQRTLTDVNEDARPAVAVDILKRLHGVLNDKSGRSAVDDDDELISPIRQLNAIEPRDPAGNTLQIQRPLTPLSDTVLLTNARGEPSVGAELKAEIDSAERIDLVLAFIRWTGIRDLLDPLQRHVARGRKLRIITTTYTGSTEPRALEKLKELGAEIKVSYDTKSTRLHAKAWLFHRETGHSTVYIGSSNLTFSAQVTGIEWNVRASQSGNQDVVRTFQSSFESYWANKQFEPYDPKQFERAVAATARGDTTELINLDITPYPFQREILDRIRGERELGRPHSLVVAATGTGKTIMAALDYKHLRGQLASTKLLFLAHRKEILRQSRNTFRHVLKNGSFGEEWVDGRTPSKWEHIFASVQSLNASNLSALPADHFDVVIVDEFHHAAASTYEKILDYLKPKHLVGLTATPDRADGLDILKWFGGRIAVELRLWDALEDQLLSPFHYFGVADNTDLSKVKWTANGYQRSQLTNIYTSNNLWISKVLKSVNETIASPQNMRAIGFCVSIEHANFMTTKFNENGLNAVAVTSKTSRVDRDQSLVDLRDGNVNVVFTVDIFNEGVDLPEVDTVLMLRPTESATIFLQQLGRGLRKSDSKQVLTVLDFVGHQHAKFRFDQRFGKLLGRTRRQIENDVESGFPFLPAGCQINLDSVAKEIVLANIKSAMPATFTKRVEELRSIGNVGLAEFLSEAMLELSDVYASSHYWTKTRRSAGFPVGEVVEGESKLGRGLGRLIHMDDLHRLTTLESLLQSEARPSSGKFSQSELAQLHMLLLSLFSPSRSQFESLDDAIKELWSVPTIRSELIELIGVLRANVTKVHIPACESEAIPLHVHATYSRAEVLAAFGISKVERPVAFREGVYFHRATKTDLFFVTMDKSGDTFSQSTRYRDFAISESEFHWESQSGTRVVSETGQRYINQARDETNVILFLRESTRFPNGQTRPFVCAGLADYLRHEGERPIAITWRLRHSLPGGLFAKLRAAVA